MVAPARDLEWELASTEAEWEGEWEEELEGEAESEEFFRSLASLGRQAVRSPAVRRLALTAARSALRGLAEHEDEGEWELEGEWEFEGEFETELNPIRRAYPDALMEHLGHAAAQSESEAEAEAFVGALVPLAAQLLPRVAPTLMRAAPGLIRGLAGVTRTLRRNPQTRPLVRTIPTIVRRTALALDRQARAGRPATPRTAVNVMARQTRRVLADPRQATLAWRRSQTLDRRYHQRARGGSPARSYPTARAAYR